MRAALPGLLVGAIGCAAAWGLLQPGTTVHTRYAADPAGPAGRAALADLALRLSPAGQLQDGGSVLDVTVEGSDPAATVRQARSLSSAILDAAPPGHEAATAPRRLEPADTRSALLLQRQMLQQEIAATDGRLAAATAALAGVQRDLAAGLRAAGDARPGQDAVEKAQTALADLQLQRIQMQSRYQDDFPALGVLDAQIRSVRSYIQDETKRLESTPRPGQDSANAILLGERDRLRAEIAQLEQRRAAVTGSVAGLDTAIAKAGAGTPAASAAAPLPLAPTSPPPVLVEASTLIEHATDLRPLASALACAAGLFVAALIRFWPRRQRAAAPAILPAESLDALLSSPATSALPYSQPVATLPPLTEIGIGLRTREAEAPRAGRQWLAEDGTAAG